MRDVKRYTRHTIRVQPERHEAARERSSAIFNNRFFADVVLAVDRLSAPDDAFVTTRMIASETMLSDSLVRPVMLRLRTAGLITALPRAGGPRSTLYYQVRRGPLWTGVQAACVASIVEDETAPTTGS